MRSELLFADYTPSNLEPKNSIGAKWQRLLDALDLKRTVAGKRVALKMHLGGGVGFSTIHPFLVRQLVTKTQAAGAKEVFLCDGPGAVRSAAQRGYTPETVGCQIVPVAGTADKYVYPTCLEPPFRELAQVELAGEIVDADALIDLAHVKAHGACGFGGASKNLSMGAVVTSTRRKLHALEGGLLWDKDACTHCKACLENCPNHAIRFSEQGSFDVFYHNCKFCQHCVLICPAKAIRLVGGGYRDFQKGMALTTSAVLKTFAPESTLFINVLTDITVFCDCWGMTTPALVPDIGILAGRDIVAIEQASLDLIKTENLIPGALPKGSELRPGRHLFEQIHGKDPYVVIDYLAELGHGSREYTLRPVD
jgi:uncharacterized Fe-S center protein